MMTTEEKVVRRGRQKKKQSSLTCSEVPLKKKRGRKPRSPSPPPLPPGPLSFFKVLVGDFKDVLFIPPMAAYTLKSLATKYVYIEDADGKYWDVKMSMVDGALAFQKGWRDFLSDHSITVGEFVIFTYTGGLLFTARIFGTSALERVDFQMKKIKGRCTKEMRATELKTDLVRISKKQKASQASEEKHSPPTTKVLRSLKRKKQTAQCDFPKVHVIESESISEGVLQVPSAGEKPVYDSNSKQSGNVLHDSEQAFHRHNDATIGKLNVISPIELVKSGIGNLKAIASKSIRNTRSTIEKGAALLHSGGDLLSKQTAEKPDAMMKTATCAVKEHADIKERSPEMSGSQVEANKAHDEMGNNGKMEQNNSQQLEMLDSEPHDDKMAALSNLESAECNTKIEFNPIEPEGIVDKFFLTVDGICYTHVEKLTVLATGTSFNANGQEEPIYNNNHATFGSETGAPCETISVVSSNPILDCTKDKRENLMPISEEYGDPQAKGSSAIAESGLHSSTKVHECKYTRYSEIFEGNDLKSGIAHDAFFDEDEKDVTPCSSRRSRVKIDRTDSADIPSSSCVTFIVRLSDDVQSYLELPKNFACQIGKLKYERKIILLQDLSLKCWPVLYHQSISFVGLIGGWVDFARANNICRGDICEFELVNKIELKFQVHVTKAKNLSLMKK